MTDNSKSPYKEFIEADLPKKAQESAASTLPVQFTDGDKSPSPNLYASS